MGKDENGYIVVETIGTFIPFVLLIVSILSLINIVTVQSRMHYALTQAANTISMYCYTLEVTDLAKNFVIMDAKKNEVEVEVTQMQEDIQGVLNGIKDISGDQIGMHGEKVIERAENWGESIVDKPEEVLSLMLNYGLSKASGEIFEKLVRPLIFRYLNNGDMSGEAYLTNANVLDGLEFTDVTLIDEDGNVKLSVEYEIEYKFGALPLPFAPKLKVNQSVKTKAWLGGSGEGYW